MHEARDERGPTGTQERPARRTGDRLLWWVVTASAAIAGLTLLGRRIVSPEPPRNVGPVFRRVPRMPESGGELLRLIGIGTLTWYVCVLSAPLFLWLSRRVPIEGPRWRSRLAMHVSIVVALILGTAAVQYWLSYAGAPVAPPLGDFVRLTALTGSLPFLTVAAAAHAVEGRTRAHDRELDAERARSQLAEARLEALTAQLQPHFLFNTLQGISTLIGRDPAAADRMLANLSDLLREVLRRADAREVEVAEELRVLGPYLEIARWRFGQRLTITTDVAGDAENALVPFFVLQPLVENALHHGVGSRAGPATVGIRVWREGATLRLTVTDDGPGVDDGPRARRGTGLANTRARLRELYADRGELELVTIPEGGSEARIAVPYRVRTPAAAGQIAERRSR
jgi:two-component system, LytTR family, sensor kinase